MTLESVSASINPPTQPVRICIGIDIGKRRHVAAVVSSSLLSQYHRYEQCPTLTFQQSREEFAVLLEFIQSYGPPESLAVLLEITGHYHRLLLDFLRAHGIACYLIATGKRIGPEKTDKRDAQRLAYQLYQFLTLEQQPGEREIRPDLPVRAELATLARLTQRRYDLVEDSVRTKNRLTALNDELFPELVQVCNDPNGPTALNLRERFPTITAIARASLDELKACRTWSRPGDAGLLTLQELAASSIGCVDAGRQASLCVEQQQLITLLRLYTAQLADLDAQITEIITHTREGKIVMSIDGIGALHAAHIVATIGTITRFRSASHLRKYFGWAPASAQSGTTLDSVRFTRRRNGPLKHTFYLAMLGAVTHESAWRVWYERLLPRLCVYDQKTGDYRGKLKVIVRLCQNMLTVIYTLLAADAEVLAAVPEGETPPEPVCYDRAKHLARLEGKRKDTPVEVTCAEEVTGD